MSDLGGFSLFELFRGEAESHAGALSEGLVRLEGSSDSSEVEPLMRAAHSIKGAARVIGLDVAVRLAHAMEDVLVAMQKGREPVVPARIDQLLRGADLLASLAREEEAAVPGWTASNGAAIDALVESLRAPATSAPPASGAEPRREGDPAAGMQDQAMNTPPADEDPARAVADENRRSADIARRAGDDLVSAPREPVPARPASAAAAPARGSSVRVSAERLDRLLQLAGETMLESRRLGGLRGEALDLKRSLLRIEDELERLRGEARRAGLDSTAIPGARALVESMRERVATHLLSVEEAIRRGEETSTQLYHEVLGSRMRPFGDAVGALPRTVRDLCRALGKEARLEIAGESVPVDRDVLARLDAPLNHLLRNALDHGVETPEARMAAGKPAQATLRVEARHHAGMLRIRVSDDGRGIDLESLRARIVRKALASDAMAADLDRQELLEFLFLPGFSTAAEVTEYSGRGVGLDVVQSTARELGGVARIESEAGRGTAFELELPITLSVVRALLVEVAGETLAFPLARIERVVRPDASEVRAVEGRMQFVLEGESVGIVDAARVLGLAEARRPAARETVVVLSSGDARYGFAVDGFAGEEDLVVRALDPRLGKVPHLSAAAVRESGDPVLIVDTEDVLQSVRMSLSEGRLRGARPAIAASGARARRALVVDDSATVREVERQLLVRMGFEVETAVDGMDGWHALREGSFDLVVSDIDMPRMNGIEFVRTLRADPRFATLPVVVVSYKDREEDRLAGLEAGATAYLTKGAFQDSTFADTVRDLVGADARPAGGAP
jgi:two-component system sensor histidine kinase and response regulator WspE